MAGIRRASDLGTQGVKTILDGSIQSADIANSTIATEDIVNGAITSAKLDTNITISGTLAATNIQALTTSVTGHGLRVRGGSGDTASIVQFTNNARNIGMVNNTKYQWSSGFECHYY